MQDITKMLGINEPKIFQHNITGPKKDVGPEIIEEIKQLNKLDIELYEEALELRKLRKFS